MTIQEIYPDCYFFLIIVPFRLLGGSDKAKIFLFKSYMTEKIIIIYNYYIMNEICQIADFPGCYLGATMLENIFLLKSLNMAKNDGN